MKKLFLLLFIVITISCEEDLPNQFTSVEGIVTDYYSKQPVLGIPLVIKEDSYLDLMKNNLKILDTIFSDSNGQYYFDFYNDTSRFYTIEILPTENYFSGYFKTITEGKKDTINFSIKPYIILNLKCFNKYSSYNRVHIINQEFKSKVEDFYCRNFENCEVIFHIVPEKDIYMQIELEHLNEMNQSDKNLSTSITFFSGKNDTTINYYY